MAQNWFTAKPFVMIEGRQPAIFEAFNALNLRIREGFDSASDAVVAAIFGISGAVDYYSGLPDPNTLDVKTIYIVRKNDGAPSGNGLYWVIESGGNNDWGFLDGLNMQDASEVAYDNTVSSIPADNVQDAIDWLKAHGGGGGSATTFIHTLTPSDATAKFITLPTAPSSEAAVSMFVREAPNVTRDLDFAVNVSTSRIMWNGLSLDGLLSSGDVVTVIYS